MVTRIYLSPHAFQSFTLFVETLAFALDVFRQSSKNESYTAWGQVFRKSADQSWVRLEVFCVPVLVLPVSRGQRRWIVPNHRRLQWYVSPTISWTPNVPFITGSERVG